MRTICVYDMPVSLAKCNRLLLKVWEKMYEKMQEVGRSITGYKKSISTWAKSKVNRLLNNTKS